MFVTVYERVLLFDARISNVLLMSWLIIGRSLHIANQMGQGGSLGASQLNSTQPNSSSQYAVSPLIFSLLLHLNLILSMFFYCFYFQLEKKEFSYFKMLVSKCNCVVVRQQQNKIVWNETSAVDIGARIKMIHGSSCARIIRNVHRLQDTHSRVLLSRSNARS